MTNVHEQTHRPAANHLAPPPTGANGQVSNDPSLGELFTGLSDDMGDLVRQEIHLAKVETKETISNATQGVVMIGAGGMIAYAGLIVLLFAVAAGLSLVMQLWVAHVIVGAIVIIVGALVLMSGRNALKNLSLMPEKTVETIKNDARWAKEQVS